MSMSPQQRPDPYYRKFETRELGIDTQTFLAHMRPVYETLQWDMYDMVRGGLEKPTRKRGLAEFAVERTDNDWSVTRMPTQPYVQSTNHGAYNRTEPRTYPEVPQDVTDHPEILKLQKAVADITLAVRADAKKLRMIFTFARAVDEEGRVGMCTLEGGPHTDGTDYIVSALVINRHNLKPKTGESSVYTMEQKKLMETVLQPSEGIFQDDRNLMHHITNIEREIRDQQGFRDMLGIDIQIIS